MLDSVVRGGTVSGGVRQSAEIVEKKHIPRGVQTAPIRAKQKCRWARQGDDAPGPARGCDVRAASSYRRRERRWPAALSLACLLGGFRRPRRYAGCGRTAVLFRRQR